jgi:hypothetical protein
MILRDCGESTRSAVPPIALLTLPESPCKWGTPAD